MQAKINAEQTATVSQTYSIT